jgi:hypothetical protein
MEGYTQAASAGLLVAASFFALGFLDSFRTKKEDNIVTILD